MESTSSNLLLRQLPFPTAKARHLQINERGANDGCRPFSTLENNSSEGVVCLAIPKRSRHMFPRGPVVGQRRRAEFLGLCAILALADGETIRINLSSRHCMSSQGPMATAVITAMAGAILEHGKPSCSQSSDMFQTPSIQSREPPNTPFGNTTSRITQIHIVGATQHVGSRSVRGFRCECDELSGQPIGEFLPGSLTREIQQRCASGPEQSDESASGL